MTNEIKAIFDTYNETVRVTLNGETIQSFTEMETQWQEKKDNAMHWILAYMHMNEKPFFYCEAWF